MASHSPEHTTIGMVGYPNVGKSSTINAILRHKKVPVSATPGRTKHFQVKNIELCLLFDMHLNVIFCTFCLGIKEERAELKKKIFIYCLLHRRSKMLKSLLKLLALNDNKKGQEDPSDCETKRLYGIFRVET